MQPLAELMLYYLTWALMGGISKVAAATTLLLSNNRLNQQPP